MALEPPFSQCESYAAVVRAVLHTSHTAAPAGYSPALSATVQALLARKPDDRPSNKELLRSPHLRGPFHAFVQSLDARAGAAKEGFERSYSFGPFAPGRWGTSSPTPYAVQGMSCSASRPVSGRVRDSPATPTSLPSESPVPEDVCGLVGAWTTSVPGNVGISSSGTGIVGGGSFENDVLGSGSLSSPERAACEAVEADAASYASDFESYSGEATPVCATGSPRTRALQREHLKEQHQARPGVQEVPQLPQHQAQEPADGSGSMPEQGLSSPFGGQISVRSGFADSSPSNSGNDPVLAGSYPQGAPYSAARALSCAGGTRGNPSASRPRTANADDGWQDEELDLVEISLDPLGHGGLGANEWRQLLCEAETLLQPPPPSDGAEEARKVRSALRDVLGTDEQVDRALGFLKERRPLGDTLEADELLLQVEVLDLLGDEGLHALPLLERCLALEDNLRVVVQ
eukprot:gnl/TRDRNA2_/TRDRNA2_147438_c0_seq1.p1 gnl/TRDRNA2_/TRDRNA2_147438_c0~~gnl/TRDRNA2_/TRDRNA2_147438_c0_seq1.p1  ORF type:complete len:477 (-),score=61.74 gnl/TRDRNA2_/TRDRNA2_147438_c0_seq1:95-1474(-)